MTESKVVAAANEILKLSAKYDRDTFSDAMYLAKVLGRLGAESFSISGRSVSSTQPESPSTV